MHRLLDTDVLEYICDENEKDFKHTRFLKECPFDYAIVPKADKIAGQFGIESYPSHAVPRQDGTVESMLIGTSDDRPHQIKTIVLRLLAEGAR